MEHGLSQLKIAKAFLSKFIMRPWMMEICMFVGGWFMFGWAICMLCVDEVMWAMV